MGKSAAGRRIAVAHHRGNALRLDRPLGAPDPSDLAAVREWVRSARGPTAIDLFSGAGGLSLGLRDAGFTVLVGADSDPWAVETHTGNLGGLGWSGDLTDPEEFIELLEQWGVDKVDLVAGGPPCQPFSRAGSAKIRDLVRAGERSASDPRAGLWNSFMAVVERLRPSAVLIENVPDLPSWDDGAVIVGFYESLRSLGYEVDARILDAFAHGVPQHRARLFIVATRGGLGFEWPDPRTPAPTLRDAIADLPPAPAAQRDERSLYFDSPRSELARRMRRRVADEERRVVWDHITRDVRADDLEAFNLMPEGGTYADLPAQLQRYRTDIFTDKYKRLAWNQVSRSITAHIAKDGYWYIHPDQPRTLSIREAARVQTFPDEFRFAGQPSHRLRQIGNAVPPLLAEAIGVRIREALEAPREGSRRNELASFHDGLLSWHTDNRRGFPWRSGGSDPWLVLMAEMCLHRASVERVAATFESLTALAPTPAAMIALGDEAQARMRALGLGQRADAVSEAARVVVEDFDGEVPGTELELRSLPSVGDYVAQAVLCFGFGRRAVLVDTSTSRITGRVFGRGEKRRWQLRLDLYRLAGPQGPDAAFNHSLLDLGALVCRAAEPRCEICPVRAHCLTGEGTAPPPRLELEAVV
jgi:DNA (cytosine-5)-methyltransferase 1